MKKYFKYLIFAGLASLFALTACTASETSQIAPPEASADGDTILTGMSADGFSHLNEYDPLIMIEPNPPNIAIIAGTIADIGPDMEWSGETAADSGSGLYIQLDFVQRHCEYVDGLYITSGIPGSANIFIDNRNTLVLGNAKIEIGAVITVFYDNSANFISGLQLDALMATAIKPLDYPWVQVAYFDDNFLSTCGYFSLAILDDAVITYKDGTPFTGEINDLSNRILAVYVTMSASPTPDAPIIHGIASSRVKILCEHALIE